MERRNREASMGQYYSNPARESAPHALPDVETFAMTHAEIVDCDWRDDDGEYLGEGWYYWYCFPGCMPDSPAFGPYATEDDALEAMSDECAEDMQEDEQEDGQEDALDASCDQCSACMINGVYCHETGCPNTNKVKIDGVWWIKTRESEDDNA
jgi:hypothetical protein